MEISGGREMDYWYRLLNWLGIIKQGEWVGSSWIERMTDGQWEVGRRRKRRSEEGKECDRAAT